MCQTNKVKIRIKVLIELYIDMVFALKPREAEPCLVEAGMAMDSAKEEVLCAMHPLGFDCEFACRMTCAMKCH